MTKAQCVICIVDVFALTQAEFSLLDFKASQEAIKMELPLYIELKGKHIDTGCGHLTVSSSDGSFYHLKQLCKQSASARMLW